MSDRRGDAGPRLRLRTAPRASAPSPAELEAITMAVRQALGAVAPTVRERGPDEAAWRLGGRWWAVAPGAWHRQWHR